MIIYLNADNALKSPQFEFLFHLLKPRYYGNQNNLVAPILL
jgi:hypothetical protein